MEMLIGKKRKKIKMEEEEIDRNVREDKEKVDEEEDGVLRSRIPWRVERGEWIEESGERREERGEWRVDVSLLL